uniref:Dolichyl-diphosphooligosaccharide--protein glycosyltransferase subunit 1 n=1 Tax=Strongyloides papillosus TaxID=174720 RepID=A0A0N5BHC5_STREA
MFVKLYLLGAALALMPLPIQPHEVYDHKLFPNVSLNIIRNTFPIDLEVKIPSDMVLVKSVDVVHRHKNSNDKLRNGYDVVKYKNLGPLNTPLFFVWVPLSKESSNSRQLKCGKISIKSRDNDSYYEKEEKIKVTLKPNDDIQFYPDEKISPSRMRYTEDGLTDIEGSTIQIRSSFDIKGFELVKMVYSHLNAIGYKEVAQTYYFGLLYVGPVLNFVDNAGSFFVIIIITLTLVIIIAVGATPLVYLSESGYDASNVR